MEICKHTVEKAQELLDSMVDAYDNFQKWTSVLEDAIKGIINRTKYFTTNTENEIIIAYVYMVKAIEKQGLEAHPSKLADYVEKITEAECKKYDCCNYMVLFRSTIIAVTEELKHF